MTIRLTGQRNHAGLILSLLRDEGPRSRSALSEATGLSPTTITKVVTPLLHQGYLREIGTEQPNAIGRPAILLEAVPGAVTVCGVQIGVGVVRLGLADAQAEVRRATAFAFDPSAPVTSVLDRIATAIRKVLSRERDSTCIGIGVGAPGPVDAAHRTNLLAINLGWRDVPIADHLEQRLGIPVVVDHNVRSMALAEARYGSWATDDLAYVYVKSGVGLGLVLKGQPFYGGHHGLSEFGHIRAMSNGTLCACGQRGCLETVLAEPYLATRLAGLGPAERSASNTESVLGLIQEQAAAGNPAAQRLLAEMQRHLAAALAIVVNLLNPELILIGGILEAASDGFLEGLRDRARTGLFPTLRDQLHIERASLREGGIAGGAAIALEGLHFGSAPLHTMRSASVAG